MSSVVFFCIGMMIFLFVTGWFIIRWILRHPEGTTSFSSFASTATTPMFTLTLDEADSLIADLERAREEAEDHQFTAPVRIPFQDMLLMVNPHLVRKDFEIPNEPMDV